MEAELVGNVSYLKTSQKMTTELFNRIQSVIDGLLATNQKITVNKVITASLFSAGGTLASFDKEVATVVKMYTKGEYEFEHTYSHTGKVDTFTLHLNKHGVMCLGYKLSGKKYFQCAMERHLDEQSRLLTVLQKTAKDELMAKTFIPNNLEYVAKAYTKLKTA